MIDDCDFWYDGWVVYFECVDGWCEYVYVEYDWCGDF